MSGAGAAPGRRGAHTPHAGPTDAGLHGRLQVTRGDDRPDSRPGSRVPRPPAFTLDVDVHVAPGEVLALLGPNGAGKTTALRTLAGLLPLTGGSFAVDGTVLDDPDRDVFVPTAQRPVAMVFQDHLLFPHLDALDNVAFGLRARGVRVGEARDRARALLERMGLGEHRHMRPRALSGGEAQRVALARALVTGPRLLLLDEPLAALDAGTRLLVRAELSAHVRTFPGATVLITHDPVDAMVLADRVLVLEQGRLVQEGRPAEVARAPRTDYVARLLGLNLWRGRSTGTTVHLDDGGTLTTSHPHDGPVLVTVPPSAVALHRVRPDGSPRNVWRCRVTGVEHHGDTVRVRLDGPLSVLADVTPAAVHALDLVPGREVWAAVKATEVSTDPV